MSAPPIERVPGSADPEEAREPGTGASERPGGAGPGDGSVRSRWRRLGAWAVLVLVLLAVILTAVLRQQPTSARPLAPDNPGPRGAMAVAELLDERGVTVHDVTSWAELRTRAGEGTTVFLADLGAVEPQQYAELAGSGAELVLAGRPSTGPGPGQELPVTTGVTSPEVVSADCADPDAQAAARVQVGRDTVRASEGAADVEVCFPDPRDATAGAYAVWQEDGTTVRHLASTEVMTNERLAEEGHSALALRMLGHHQELLWYLPSAPEAAESEAAPLLPPALVWAGGALLAAVLLLGLAQGRRLGSVVTEIMPVVVPAAETVRGRGRLYRRGGDREHAAAALRAGTARRVARRLGLPRSTGRRVLVEAIARGTGHDPAAVDALLYGAPPEDDAGLLDLSVMLDTLEREVHRS